MINNIIYRIICPKTKDVLYIGKTYNFEGRMAKHLSSYKFGKKKPTNLQLKIKELWDEGLKPTFEIILDNIPSEKIYYVEQEYIQEYLSNDVKLLNMIVKKKKLERSDVFNSIYWQTNDNYLSYDTIAKLKQKFGQPIENEITKEHIINFSKS